MFSDVIACFKMPFNVNKQMAGLIGKYSKANTSHSQLGTLMKHSINAFNLNGFSKNN